MVLSLEEINKVISLKVGVCTFRAPVWQRPDDMIRESPPWEPRDLLPWTETPLCLQGKVIQRAVETM